jgi:hypothetical protein
MLGDLLSRFTNDAIATEAILRLGDVTLLAALRERADAEGLALGALAALAVQRYAREASDEEWVTLMGAMQRSGDSGLICLKHALRHVTHDSN